jgi:class I fructose-bisphosphate aldolase
MQYSDIQKILGDHADYLLNHESKTVSKDSLHSPNPNHISEIMMNSDRNNSVLRNLSSLYNHGNLGRTGYLSILPVDQGVEHSAGASFAKNPIYFDPENIIKLAINSGCNGVTSTLGVLGLMSRKYAHQIPFILKLNHNELLSYPNQFREQLFADVDQAFDMGAVGVGATIYFGSPNSGEEIQAIRKAFQKAHKLGLFTILWCYVRNDSFKQNGKNYETSADLTGQANHLGVTLEADIIKQKLPDLNGGFKAMNTGSSSYGKLDEKIYTNLTSEHPIDLARYQVLNCYSGKIPLISSGGGSADNDLQDAVRSAVINKKAGGSGLIMGRKAFQREMEEGVEILKAVQSVYLCKEVGLS